MNINKGLIVDSGDGNRELKAGGKVNFPSGNQLVYHKVKGVRGFAFDYITQDKTIRLNDLAEDHRWRFVPVDGVFFFRIYGSNSKRFPEIHLPFRHDSHELTILKALHEVGHAVLCSRWHKIVLSAIKSTIDDKFKKGHLERAIESSVFFSELGTRPDGLYEFKVNGYFNRQVYASERVREWYFGMPSEHNPNSLYRNIERFDERFAWAFALWTVMQEDLLLQYDFEDFRHLYVPHLWGYDPSYVSSPDYKKYTRGATDHESWKLRTEERSWKNTPEGQEKSKDFRKLLDGI